MHCLGVAGPDRVVRSWCMSTQDGPIDYSSYTQSELTTCLQRIDREKAVQNYENLIAEIDRRKSSGQWDEGVSKFSDFVSTQRFVYFGFFIVLIFGYFAVHNIYRQISGAEMTALAELVFFVVAIMVGGALVFLGSRQTCPKCNKRLGILGHENLIDYGRCPNCGYSAKKK